MWTKLLALIARVFNWRASSDGTLDGHYKDGDKTPGGGTLFWINASLPNLTNKTTGTPYSSDIRAALSGTLAASAVLTVTTVSGTDAAANGWLISGDNLTNAGSNVGAGALRIRATSGGVSIDSDPIGWSWVAPAATDTQAPTIPTGFTVTPILGGHTIAHDASSDPFDGTVPAALVKDYRLRRDGVVVLTTAASSGLSQTFTLTNIGVISSPSTPSALQSGAQWTLTAAGTGVHGTLSDQCAFVNSDFAGDFTVIAKLEAFSSSNQYSTSGIMIRESLDVNAPFVAIYVQPSSPANGLQVKRRANSASVSVNRATVAGITSAYVRLKRVGTDITASYSTTGGVWTDLITVSDTPMTPAVKAGAFLSSQLPGTSVTAICNQLSVVNTAGLSYNYTTSGTASYTITARDNANNESAESAAISATPLVSAPATNTHRFKPGHYVFYTNKSLNPATSAGLTGQQGLFTLIDSIAGGKNQVKGVQITLPWKQLEGPTRGDYTRAYQILDPIFAKCDAVSPKKLVCLSVLERGFGSGSGAGNILPEYLVAAGEYIEAPGTTTYSGGLKSAAAQWHAVVTDWLLGLLTAIAARYDTNPLFAMIGAGETSIGFPSSATFPNGSPADYTFGAFNTQVRRVFTEGKKVFLKTPMRLAANFYGSATDMKSLIDFVRTTTYTGGVIIGGPDPEFDLPLPTNLRNAHRTITANEVFRGNTQATDTTVTPPETYWVQGGGEDLRGVVPWCGEQQEFGFLGVRAGFNEPISDIDAYQRGTAGAQNVMNASYMIWTAQTYRDDPAQQWPAIKTYIETTINGAINTTVPSEGSWS